MTEIRFQVLGVPVQQSGMREITTPNGHHRQITTGGVGLLPWRQQLAKAAMAEAEIHGCLTGPVKALIEFRFPMPKSRPKWQRERGWAHKITTPDSDKLLRSIGDGLTEGGLIQDDRLLVMGWYSKIEVWQQWTGADIKLITLEP